MEKRQPFHVQLRYERERRSWSQNDLASKIGSDAKSVRRWENGKALPGPYNRQKLTELFGIDAEAFGLFVDTYQDEPSQTTELQEDWGEAPSVSHIYGRHQECTELKRWIEEQQCRVIAVLGMGGVGKTTFATKLAMQVKEDFPFIFWRSLQHAPSPQHIVQQCIHFLARQHETSLPEELDEQISLLIGLLREHRCLLILDNVESILQSGHRAGQYEKGYEGYGRLIQRIGDAEHQSCLLLTSREKPEYIAHVEGKASPVRSFTLSGVGQSDGRKLLQNKELLGSDEHWRALVTLYAGNPLALQLVAEPIHAAFGGDIARFLQEEKTAIGDINILLEQQFHRLSAQEQEILYWLAIEREAIPLEEIRQNLVHVVAQDTLLEGLASLRRRSMIETRSANTFTLQPVIMEYVTMHLVKQACYDFSAAIPGVWMDFSFIKAQVKDYVRDIQVRFILSPIAERLRDTYGQYGIEQGLKDMLVAQRHPYSLLRSYTAGNALNLLTYLHSDLRGADFSRLMIWQAYLQNAFLPDVNFANAQFISSTFTNTFGNILSVGFSPGGDCLVAGTTEGDIWVYEALTGTPLLTYRGHSDGVWSVTFSPDGQLLASSSDDQTIRLWDAGSSEIKACLNILREHTNRVRAVAFSPNGRLLASGSDDQTIRLWDPQNGHCLKVLRGHSERVWSVTFSPDGSLLASGSTDQTVKVWDVTSGKCLKTFRGHTDGIRSVAFHAAGHILASGSDDQTVRLWNIDSGEEIRVLRGHTNRVWSVAFNTAGDVLASSSEDRTIRLWDSSTDRSSKILQGHMHGVRSVAFSGTSLLASGGDDQSFRLWDIATGYCLKTVQGYTHRIWSVAFSADGRFLASSSDDQTVRLWEVASGQCMWALQNHSHGVKAIALSPTAPVLASGGEDQTICLWNLSSGECYDILRGHSDWVRTVTFSPDGTLLAGGSEDNTIRIWNATTGDCLNTLQQSNWVRSVAFSPDGLLLASGSDDQTVRLWEVATGHCLRTFEGHSGRVRSVTFSPDGQLLASGSEDKLIRFWQVATGACDASLSGHTNWVRSVAFSPDGQLLASSSDDKSIRLWDVASQSLLQTLQGHTNRIRWVTFSPDGQTIASSSDDGTIKLWDRQKATCLKTLIHEKPYERMNITSVQGLTPAQIAALRALGAIEEL